MNDMNKPKLTRKQAEAKILKDMRHILNNVDSRTVAKAHKAHGQGNDEESVSRLHVMSVISEFTSLKKQTKH